MTPSAVLFDIDGTLVDSNFLHIEAWAHAFARLGLTVPAWRIQRSIGADSDKLLDGLIGEAPEDVRARAKSLHSEYYEQSTPRLNVFDGARDGAWEVTDPVAPLGVYGASKLGGELAVRTSGARHAIVRTAWVVSAHGSNFIKTMLRVAATKPSLRVVDDQHGSPTAAADLAAALATITMRLVDDPAAPVGTYHFSNAGAVTWAGFAREIFAQSAARGGATAQVIGIPTSEYPTPATRPANSLLSHDAIIRDYGIHPAPWQTSLGAILDELIGSRT